MPTNQPTKNSPPSKAKKPGSITVMVNQLLSTRQGQGYATLVVSVFIVAALITFGALPIIGSVLGDSEQNAIKLDLLEQMNQKQRNLERLIKQDAENPALTLALQAAMPDSYNQAELMDDIVELAKQYGVQLSLVNFGNLPNTNDLRDVFGLRSALFGKSLSINANGTRYNLKEFINGVENLRRIVNIKSVSLFKRESNGIDPIPAEFDYNADIQAEIYFSIQTQ